MEFRRVLFRSIRAKSNRAVRYRIVTGWRTGLHLRHYDVSLGKGGAPEAVRPAGPAAVPCPERQLPLPISARGSRVGGVYHVRGGTNRVESGRATRRERVEVLGVVVH